MIQVTTSFRKNRSCLIHQQFDDIFQDKSIDDQTLLWL
jgi:hypothetical protein